MLRPHLLDLPLLLIWPHMVSVIVRIYACPAQITLSSLVYYGDQGGMSTSFSVLMSRSARPDRLIRPSHSNGSACADRCKSSVIQFSVHTDLSPRRDATAVGYFFLNLSWSRAVCALRDY